MAEYVRGLDNRESEQSGHNNNDEQQTRGRIRGVDFSMVNYEQRRGPYGNSRSTDGNRYDNGQMQNMDSGQSRENV